MPNLERLLCVLVLVEYVQRVFVLQIPYLEKIDTSETFILEYIDYAPF